ncbi:hypothetical protein OQA88_13496 [Cercophora sp. LCS_1]
MRPSTQPFRRLNETPWRFAALTASFFLFMVFLLWIVVFAAFLTNAADRLPFGILITRITSPPQDKEVLLSPGSFSGCRPDDTFSPFIDDYNWWSSNGFFQITLGFGSLTFAQVKIIDIIWNLAIGRLGQATAVYVSFRVFADYLATSMIRHPATYTTFWIVYLHREPSVLSWFRLAREAWHGGVASSRLAVVFMLSTMLFLISIPTLMSAMAGYSPVNRAFVRRSDSSLIPFSELSTLAYVIHDGQRIGLSSGHHVPLQVTAPGGDPWIQRVPEVESSWTLRLHTSYRCDEHDYPNETCTSMENPLCLRNAVSEYVAKYGFFGLHPDTTEWQGRLLNPPALNISAFYFPPPTNETDCFGGNWTAPSTSRRAFSNPDNRAYGDSTGRGYTLAEVVANGTCQPVLEACSDSMESCQLQTYQWGVSFQQSVIVAILTLIWSIGLTIMSLIAYHRLPLVDTPETPRGWRAVIHLGEAIREFLERHTISPLELTDQEVKTKIFELSLKEPRGGTIRFNEPKKNRRGRLGDMMYVQIRSTPKWTLRGLLLASLICGIMIHVRLGGPILSCILLSLIVGQFWAIIFGRDMVARLIILFMWSLVGTATGVAIVWTI